MNLLARLREYLFDFSAGKENGYETEEILRAALASSCDDVEFEKALRQIIDVREGDTEAGFHRYSMFLGFMWRNVRPQELGVGVHARAQHIIDGM